MLFVILQVRKTNRWEKIQRVSTVFQRLNEKIWNKIDILYFTKTRLYYSFGVKYATISTTALFISLDVIKRVCVLASLTGTHKSAFGIYGKSSLYHYYNGKLAHVLTFSIFPTFHGTAVQKNIFSSNRIDLNGKHSICLNTSSYFIEIQRI